MPRNGLTPTADQLATLRRDLAALNAAADALGIDRRTAHRAAAGFPVLGPHLRELVATLDTGRVPRG